MNGLTNKKGDISTTILVIGVIAVCALALISFYNSKISIQNSFGGVRLIEKMNSEIEEGSLSNHYVEKKVSELAFSFPSFSEEKLLVYIEYSFP